MAFGGDTQTLCAGLQTDLVVGEACGNVRMIAVIVGLASRQRALAVLDQAVKSLWQRQKGVLSLGQAIGNRAGQAISGVRA